LGINQSQPIENYYFSTSDVNDMDVNELERLSNLHLDTN